MKSKAFDISGGAKAFADNEDKTSSMLCRDAADLGPPLLNASMIRRSRSGSFHNWDADMTSLEAPMWVEATKSLIGWWISSLWFLDSDEVRAKKVMSSARLFEERVCRDEISDVIDCEKVATVRDTKRSASWRVFGLLDEEKARPRMS